MEVKVLGNGELGSVISQLLKVEALGANQITSIKNCIIFNCTPAEALPEITKHQPDFIINCCKGVHQGKLPTDYLYNNNRLVSIGGYYKGRDLTNAKLPIYVGGNLQEEILDIIKKIFSIEGTSNNSRNIELAGILKNIYLLDYSLKFEDILKEISDHNLLDEQALRAFIDDYKKCIEYKSRNYLFGKIFHQTNKVDHLSELGLVEGYNSLDHITLDTPLVNKIKKMYKK